MTARFEWSGSGIKRPIDPKEGYHAGRDYSGLEDLIQTLRTTKSFEQTGEHLEGEANSSVAGRMPGNRRTTGRGLN